MSRRGAGQGEGEADSSMSREPDKGLDPKTLKSWPEPPNHRFTDWF